jgi:hypothetical protein
MGIQGKVVAAIAGALAVIALVPGIAAAKLVVADYRFDDSLSSSVGGANSLTNVGAGNDFATETVRGKSERVFEFEEGNGLSLVDAGLVPANNHSVVLEFRFEALSNYRRVLDWSGGTTEPGLYVHSGALNFYDGEGMEAAQEDFAADRYVEVALTRDPQRRIDVYANGAERLRYTDIKGPDSALFDADGLRFFVDDTDEESAGAVARIRLFNRALSADQVRRVFEGCQVPKVKGKKKKRAKKKLTKAGCSVGKVKRKFSDKVEKGRVIKQKPKKGTKRDFEFAVKLTISKGPGG